MGIDIRAEVTCNLGTVITGSFADDYLQSNGLIKTRGEVVLEGTFTPVVGTQVYFTFEKGGNTCTLPRMLRVLSSFADPFRRTTTIQLGCKLTYLENRKPPLDNPNSKDENNVPCYVYAKATLPISATYVFQHCLTALGITSDPIPLTSKFSVDEFDLSPGYLQVMSDLLQSEGYIGYLDINETLRFSDLSVTTGVGPLLTSADVADLGPIGSGDLPGESVVVRWNNLRLLPPDQLPDDERLRRSWEIEETFGAPVEVSVSYTADDGSTVSELDQFYPYTLTTTRYDQWDRKIESVALTLASSAEVNNRWASDTFKQGGKWNVPVARLVREELQYKNATSAANNVDLLALQRSNESMTTLKAELVTASDADTEPAWKCKFEPEDGYDIVNSQTTTSYFSELELAGSLNIDSYIPIVNGSEAGVLSFGMTAAELESTVVINFETDEASGISKAVTQRTISKSQTVSGQQDLANLAQDLDENSLQSGVAQLLTVARRQVYVGAETVSTTQREYGLQRRPSQKDRNNTANTKPDVTETVAKLTWVYGSTTSTAVTEFTLPYAPDDEISWTALGGYTSTKSDARQKALRYGRIQNALLLGNRNGVSLQMKPELLPHRPYDPLYLEASGITASYRVNGSSWAFDANGIVASTDALFMGAVSAAANTNLSTSWVPLAPNTTSLPLPYTVTSGGPTTGYCLPFPYVISPTGVLPPYVEIIDVEGVSRTTAVVTVFPYTLVLPTTSLLVFHRTNLTVGSRLTAAGTSFALAGQAAQFSYSRGMRGLPGSFALTGHSAGSVRNRRIGANAGTFTHTGQAARQVYQRTPLPASAGSYQLLGQSANLFTGISMSAQSGSFVLTGKPAGRVGQSLLSADAGTITLSGQQAQLATSDYFSKWATQTYSYDALVFPDWWAD